MIKNWGVIGGIAAAVAAGVYVLWGPITERKKRKRGKSCCDRVAHTLYLWHCLHCSKLQWLVVPCRYGTRSFKLGEHLLSELVTSGLSSMSVVHQVAGEVCSSAFNPVLQRQPAIHDTAPASQRYIKPVCHISTVYWTCWVPLKFSRGGCFCTDSAIQWWARWGWCSWCWMSPGCPQTVQMAHQLIWRAGQSVLLLILLFLFQMNSALH